MWLKQEKSFKHYRFETRSTKHRVIKFSTLYFSQNQSSGCLEVKQELKKKGRSKGLWTIFNRIDSFKVKVQANAQYMEIACPCWLIIYYYRGKFRGFVETENKETRIYSNDEQVPISRGQYTAETASVQYVPVRLGSLAWQTRASVCHWLAGKPPSVHTCMYIDLAACVYTA